MLIKRIGVAVFLFTLTLLSGCKMVVLDPKGMIAADEKDLLIKSVLLMLIVVIPVILLTLSFAFRYRASNKQAVYAPNWSHNTFIEVICWSIPCVIIIILGYMTWTSSHRLDPYRPLDSDVKPLTIQAIALEWKWLFIYPEENIATVNTVEFPVNRPVTFLITSEGPMNSFLIPQLAGQIYAMAGMQTKLHLIANKVGDYDGLSSNFSGDGFSEMKFIAHATTESDFTNWVKHIKASSNTILDNAQYEALLKPSENVTPLYFKSADQTIFHTSIMKSMMPMNAEKKGASHVE